MILELKKNSIYFEKSSWHRIWLVDILKNWISFRESSFCSDLLPKTNDNDDDENEEEENDEELDEIREENDEDDAHEIVEREEEFDFKKFLMR